MNCLVYDRSGLWWPSFITGVMGRGVIVRWGCRLIFTFGWGCRGCSVNVWFWGADVAFRGLSIVAYFTGSVRIGSRVVAWDDSNGLKVFTIVNED